MAAAQARRDNDNELGFMRRVSDKFVTGSVFLSCDLFCKSDELSLNLADFSRYSHDSMADPAYRLGTLNATFYRSVAANHGSREGPTF